jgi:chitinase
LQNQEPAYSSDPSLSVDGAIDTFLRLGCPKHKLTLAIRPYGFTFARISPTSPTTPGSPSAGQANSLIYPENIIQTPALNTEIYLQDYKTVCRVIEDPKWTKKFDDSQKVPYAYNDVFWMSFDNFNSYNIKV